MGDTSAMNSLNRVLEAHGNEIVEELTVASPGTQLTYMGPILSNNTYSIAVTQVFRNTQGNEIYIDGEPIDIDNLAERFPDCKVGY